MKNIDTRDHTRSMNDMMNFRDPFSMGHHHVLEEARPNHRHRQQQTLVPHSGFMGMSMFSNMDSMFRDIHRQMVGSIDLLLVLNSQVA